MYPSRNRAAAIARDTLDVLARGSYQNRAGITAQLSHLLDAARAGTVGYPPGEPLPKFSPAHTTIAYEVVNDTTLEAARF